MAYQPTPPGKRLENCPECNKLFYSDIDNRICKHCQGGYQITDGKLYVVNKERFAKQKDFKVKSYL